MAEFKDVVEKTKRICHEQCHEHIGCTEECPLYNFTMFCPTDPMNEVNELEYTIMNYELKGERK